MSEVAVSFPLRIDHRRTAHLNAKWMLIVEDVSHSL